MLETIVNSLTNYLKHGTIVQEMTKKSKKKEIKCCSKPLEFILQEGQSWQVYIPKTATCSTCHTYYEKKKGNDFAYKHLGNGGYVCTLDGKNIQSGEVAHPIWDGPFPMSGSGKCKYEYVPYCHKHEEKPEFNGNPIQIKFENSELYKRMMARK